MTGLTIDKIYVQVRDGYIRNAAVVNQHQPNHGWLEPGYLPLLQAMLDVDIFVRCSYPSGGGYFDELYDCSCFSRFVPLLSFYLSEVKIVGELREKRQVIRLLHNGGGSQDGHYSYLMPVVGSR